MKKINKSGFTMVELLATIVIIGILGTIGVVGVTKSMKSAKDRYYVAQNKLFISAAQTYFTDNKSRLPMHEPLSKRVTLKTLNEANYIEKMVDYNKKPYNDDSYVKVTKLGLNLYSYEGTLIDSKGTAQEYKESGEEKASVIFTVDDEQFSNKSDKKYTNKEKTVNIEIIDNDGIAGYIISVQKRDKTVNEMDYIEAGGVKSATNKVTISTDKYGDGEYNIKVKVYDKYNDQESFISGKIVVDTIAPTCTYTGATTKWTNKSRTITYTGEDELSGIDQSTEQQKKYGEGNTVLKTTNGIKYTIKDKAGNSTQCDYTTTDINVYYDKELPACTYSGESTSWAKSRTIKVGCNDNSGSGCANNTGNAISFEGKTITTSQISGTIKDKAGNETSCSKQANVYIDNTEPKTTIQNIYKNKWVNESYAFTVDTAVGESGIDHLERKIDNGSWEKINTSDTNYKTNVWGIERNSTVCYRAVSKSGMINKDGACTKVKIDKTAPEISSLGFNDKKFNNITHNGATIKVQCTDNLSGIKSFKLDPYKNYEIEAITAWDNECKTYNNGIKCEHSYKASGWKATYYTCVDKAGNSAVSTASGYNDEEHKEIACGCRRKSDGKEVFNAHNKNSTGTDDGWNCDNAHNNWCGKDYSSGAMYLSCRFSDLPDKAYSCPAK